MFSFVNAYLLIIIYQLNILQGVNGQNKLPDTIKLCKKSDSNLNDCLKDAIQGSFTILAKGLPEFGLPMMDPLHLHEMLLKQEDEGSVHIKLHMWHVDLYGLSNGEVSSVDADWENFRIKINLKINKNLSMVGDYDVDGRVMVLPINGSGKFNFSFEGGEGHIELKGKGIKKDGMTYMDLEEFNWDYKPDHMTINMENLFYGDKKRSDTMNTFLNDNWRQLLDELQDTTQKSFAESFKEFSRIIFDKVPIDYIALS